MLALVSAFSDIQDMINDLSQLSPTVAAERLWLWGYSKLCILFNIHIHAVREDNMVLIAFNNHAFMEGVQKSAKFKMHFKHHFWG